MRRREFLGVLGSAAAWSLAAQAQQSAMPVIGYLSGATFEMMREYVAAFHRGLADAGFAEGRNIAIEYRWAEGHNDRLRALATDLVRRRVAIIVVGGSTPGALAAKAATETVPIVFLWVPIRWKLVSSRASHSPAATSRGLQTSTWSCSKNALS
ncbi:MAG: ABC transporter substrate-binding protein [Alphaproteobacteria bacterium]|nr:MAG: ABC transporter substrate-binding protein [Alphaproteobacteria bacterium]